MSDHAEVVHLPATPIVVRRDVAGLAAEADQIRELQKAVLRENVDFGTIPGMKKPSLFKSGAEWLLKWARFGHRMEVVETERDEDGKRYGVTYRCIVHALDAPEIIVATCDGYCGYDEPDREEHVNKWNKTVPRAPWNTIIKMAQKRALIGAALQATSTSGLFTQDVEDYAPTPAAETASDAAPRANGSPGDRLAKFEACAAGCGGKTQHRIDGKPMHVACAEVASR